MIQAINISKRFGDLEVLRDVQLNILEKEVISIVGPSGAGKSTLLQILGSIEQPDSGSVLYHHTNITDLKNKELASFRNENIGFIFQFHHLLPEFTALENVCMPAFIKGRDRSESEAKAKELLDMLGLGSRIEHKPNEMSGGEQQRVAVARALINNPKVVFADEPSGNLDTKNADELHQLFFDLRDKLGQTFVIVTHNNELAQQTDRKIEMVDGRVVG